MNVYMVEYSVDGDVLLNNLFLTRDLAGEYIQGEIENKEDWSQLTNAAWINHFEGEKYCIYEMYVTTS